MSRNTSAGGSATPRGAGAAVCALGVVVLLATASGVAGHAELDATLNDRFEPNDEFASAANVTTGEYTNLLIATGESDFFRIELQQSEQLTARINFSDSTGDLDLRVYDPARQEIGASTSTSDNESVTVTAGTAGTYYVRVIGFSGAEAPYSMSLATAPGNARPQASLDVSTWRPTVDQQVVFDASNSTDPDGTIQTYRWDFDGDGVVDETTSGPSGARTTHTYPSQGPYNAVVTVVDDDGATATATRDVIVSEPTVPPPVAACSASPTTANPEEPITFDATASEKATHADFDVDGDGDYEIVNVSTLRATYQYTEAGTFESRVRVENSAGSDTAGCGTVTILENSPPNARLTISPQFATPGQQVAFDASNSTDTDGTIQTYRWDFDGDGTVDRTTSGSGAASVTHTYSMTDTYSPVVTIVDDDGATDKLIGEVIVEQAASVTCSVTPRTVEVGDEVTVDASGSTGVEIIQVDVDGDPEYERIDDEDFVVTYTYETAGEYLVRVRGQRGGRTDIAECGAVTVERNEPPNAGLTVSPRSPPTGTRVTLDASGSTDPDGRVVAYRWDLDGDGTVDRRTNRSRTTTSYRTGGQIEVGVVVVDDDGATATAIRVVVVETPTTTDQPSTETATTTDQPSTGTRTERPTPTRTPPPMAVSCTLSTGETETGESVVVDASDSRGVTAVRYDFDGDGTYDTGETDDLRRNHTYDTAGEYQVRVEGIGPAGREAADCGALVVAGAGGGGSDLPVPGGPVPWALAVIGLGVGAYYWSGGTGDGEGGGAGSGPSAAGGTTEQAGDSGRPDDRDGAGVAPTASGKGAEKLKKPKRSDDPKQPDYEAGTLLTPPTPGPVTVTDLGFEPDLVLLTASTGVRSPGGTPPGRPEGWSYGVAARNDDGIEQTSVALAVDGDDAARGTSTEDVTVELVVSHEDVPDRITGRTTEMTDDGFELSFDVPERGGDQFPVHYRAFTFGADTAVEVGHARTPAFPGRDTLDLDVDADHAMVLATNAFPGEEVSADPAVGFSRGDVVGRRDPAQVAQTSILEPSEPTATAAALFDDRALHLQFVQEGRRRGRTTARVTGLGRKIGLDYEAVYDGAASVDGGDGTLLTYVAMETRDLQPVLGYFQLPERGDDRLAVDVGFEPGMVEFTTVGGRPDGDEAFPPGVAHSHGTVVGTDADNLRQYVVPGAVDASTSTHGSHAGVSRGVAAVVLAPEGDGRRDLTVTALTDTGFELSLTDRQPERGTGPDRPYVFYKAWPDPESGAVSVPDDVDGPTEDVP